jgi:hypothetical protein
MNQKMIDRIKQLEDREGRITPDVVLKDAEKSSSPLHDYFEWNDTKAAHAYRVDQARMLIRSVEVIIKTETISIRSVGYVRDPEAQANEQGYRSVSKLRSEKGLAHEALTAEFIRIAGALRRAKDLAAAFDLENEIGDLFDRFNKLSIEVESRSPHH